MNCVYKIFPSSHYATWATIVNKVKNSLPENLGYMQERKLRVYINHPHRSPTRARALLIDLYHVYQTPSKAMF